MKRLLTGALALAGFAGIASAHPFSPPTLQQIAASDQVYLVHVVSSDTSTDRPGFGPVTFTIDERLRGQAPSPMVLIPYQDDFNPGTKWILFHNHGGFKNWVGWAMKGDCEWLPIAFADQNGVVIAQWVGSLDGVRTYLQQHPAQP